MKITPSFIEARPLVTVDVPGKLPKIPKDAIVRIRPSAEATNAQIEKAVALIQKTAASCRVLAKPKGSAVAQAVVADVLVQSIRVICETLAEATPEKMRDAVIAEVEERIRNTGL